MALNVDTWEWRVVNAGGEHPVPRAWAASAVIGDCLYVHSGYSYASQAVFREMYAMCGEVWEHHPAISHDPKARMGHTMAAINGSQLVIFGGITREDEYLKDVWVYVPSERVYYPFKAQKYQVSVWAVSWIACQCYVCGVHTTTYVPQPHATAPTLPTHHSSHYTHHPEM